MDDKTTSALARRLAAYSASVGVALAAAPATDAQIVYHDFDPDVAIGAPYRLDFDDSGFVDFIAFWTTARPYTNRGGALRTTSLRFAFRVPVPLRQFNGVLGYDAPDFVSPNVGGASRLSVGDVVGPPGTKQEFYPYAIAASTLSGAPYYPFGGGEEGFVGFRFVGDDGERRYGWLRLFAEGNGGTLYEYAYEATPDTPIAAGDRSAVLLDGAVNETVFPPEGGMLVYTFTVSNDTDDPLPLDLWVEVGRESGAVRFRRRLGSGTLPPGASVTRAISLPVLPDVPADTYDVKFKVGDFGTRQFLTFERFVITKQGAARTGGEATLPLFEVIPSSGDLFADTASADLGLRATHVLDTPAPNPSDGRTTLSLEVTETQPVRVEVLDALGRRVAVLHDGVLAAGTAHRLVFDGSALPVGVYAVRAVGETFSDVRTVTLAH
jgi:hypothetical protein